MAHIPKDDIRQLWEQTPQHNWSAFHKTPRRTRTRRKEFPQHADRGDAALHSAPGAFQ